MTTQTQDKTIEGASPEVLAASIEERIAALRARRAEVDTEIDTLTQTLRTLKRPVRSRKRSTVRTARKTRVRSAEKQAGPGNVKRVREALVALGGRATQAEITKRAGLHSGTVTYALRALVEESQVHPTGEKVGRSPEYAFIPNKLRRSPGSVTTAS